MSRREIMFIRKAMALFLELWSVGEPACSDWISDWAVDWRWFGE